MVKTENRIDMHNKPAKITPMDSLQGVEVNWKLTLLRQRMKFSGRIPENFSRITFVDFSGAVLLLEYRIGGGGGPVLYGDMPP